MSLEFEHTNVSLLSYCVYMYYPTLWLPIKPPFHFRTTAGVLVLYCLRRYGAKEAFTLLMTYEIARHLIRSDVIITAAVIIVQEAMATVAWLYQGQKGHW